MESLQLSQVVAMDRQGAIGRNGALPWHLPDDLRQFKALTYGKPVLMGRKTYASIGKPLPGRRNLVLSRDPSFAAPGIEVFHGLQAALAAAANQATELMVIGGGELYALTLPLARRLLVTTVDTVVDRADAWFPPVDYSQWSLIARTPHAADERHAFGFELVEWHKRGRRLS